MRFRSSAGSETRSGADIWLLDLARGASTRFTFDPTADRFPVWSPDGTRIAFSSGQDGRVLNLYQKLSSGAGDNQLLLQSDLPKLAMDWSRDGKYLLYVNNDPKTKYDLWVLPMTGDHQPFPFLRTPFQETGGRFSPDTRWIAYTSNESGRDEIYVRPFPPAANGGKWMVSRDGGVEPGWRRDGKELYYIGPGGKLMAVAVSGSSAFQAGIPEGLFTAPVPSVPTVRRWDVTPDGKRFLMSSLANENRMAPVTVVLNWEVRLRK